MPRLITPEIPRADDQDAQVELFRRDSFVIIPEALSSAQVSEMNTAMDRDMERYPFLWLCGGHPDYNCNMVLTEPVFEPAIRNPRVLPLIERLMGGPICFEELSVRHREPEASPRPDHWHRDRPHWLDHPLHLDFPQVIYYLTDVDETTHCFSISPEPADGEILEPEEQIARRGVVHFHGEAGGAILFNCATLHTATLRQTTKIRRNIQVYYGHPHRACLSEVTLIPPRLWRDHPDAEIRRFYGKLNTYTHLINRTFGIEDAAANPLPSPGSPA